MAKPYSQKTIDQILLLRSQGLSYRKIALAVGVSKAGVQRVCDPRHVERAKEWRRENVDKYRETRRAWRHKNLDRVCAYTRSYRERNPQHASEYRKKNIARYRAYCAKRHAAKLQAMPPWLTDAQKAEITAIYVECRRIQDETGVPHHVDHIHPLQGETVCGLHVPWNLQILTQSENCSKRNKLVE